MLRLYEFVETDIERGGDPPELDAAVSRITDALGWWPRHDDLDFIVRTAIAWQKKMIHCGKGGAGGR